MTALPPPAPAPAPPGPQPSEGQGLAGAGAGALLSRAHSGLDLPFLYALDTETSRFREPQLGWKGKTRTAPFGGHDLVLGSLAGEGNVQVLHRDALCARVADLLNSSYHIVFHHCAFDIPVLCRAAPFLLPLFLRAVEERRIHDTKILEVLIQIAVGSRAMNNKQLVTSPSLAKLAKARANLDLDKTSGIRVNFAQFMAPSIPIPPSFLEYASWDAIATYLVYRSQLAEASVLQNPPNCRFPVSPNAHAQFGLLSENVQIKGALAFEWLERYPLRVDQTEARRLSAKLEAELLRFEEALIKYGWASRGPKSGKFSIRLKKIREVLLSYAADHQLDPQFSPTGLLNISYDFWARSLPKISRSVYDSPLSCTALEERLSVWLRYMRGRKLLSTYLYVYACSPVHYPRYQNIGARTGRTSCSQPNAQNIPKHHDGIRALFVPSPDQVLVEADFDFAELVALAQVYHDMYGGSVLEDMINSGEDPHIARARRLVPDYDALSEEKRWEFRQAAKAVNFGLPGGLGARTFRNYAAKRFQFDRTEEEIRSLRQTALQTDPQLSLYLEDKMDARGRLQLIAQNLNLPLTSLVTLLTAWDRYRPGHFDPRVALSRVYNWISKKEDYPIPVPLGVDPRYDLTRQTTRTLTGRVRGRASYTEAHNTPFQGLISDAVKISLWNLYVLWLEDPFFEPVCCVHDSILVQCPPPRYEDVKAVLDRAMVQGLKSLCPDVRVGVAYTKPLERWGKSTNPWGDEE